MNAAIAASRTTRIAAFAAAVLTSTVVLGATVIGMQPAGLHGVSTVVALERAAAPAVN